MLLVKRYTNSGAHFDLDKLKKEVEEFSNETEKDNFWNDRSNALEVINKLNHSKNILETELSLYSKRTPEALQNEPHAMLLP